jgi:DNA repair photolyase
MPAILAEAAARGVKNAGHILMRLPHAVKDLFSNWVRQHFPDRADKVLHAIQDVRGGRLNDPRFGSRMSGEGERAETIAKMFEVTCRKLGLNQTRTPLTTEHFRRNEQIELFA